MRRAGGHTIVDLVFNVTLSVVVLLVLAIILIKRLTNLADIESKAEVIVKVKWPLGRDDDVDVHMGQPDGERINYLNKTTNLMHLDRDDLGGTNDRIRLAGGRKITLPYNEEMVSIRGISPGLYAIQVHLYRRGKEPVTPFTVEITDLNPQAQSVFFESYEFVRKGEKSDSNADPSRAIFITWFEVSPDGKVVIRDGEPVNLKNRSLNWRLKAPRSFFSGAAPVRATPGSERSE